MGFIRTWQQCRLKTKNLTATYRKLRDSNRRSGQGRVDFPFYSIIDGVRETRLATQLVNRQFSTSSNSAPPLDMPGVSADDSKEATTADEEDDEVEDGEENGGGSGSPPSGSGSGSHSRGGGSGSHSRGGGSGSPSGDGPSGGSGSGSHSGDGSSRSSLSGNHSGGGGSGSHSDVVGVPQQMAVEGGVLQVAVPWVVMV